MIRHSTLLCEYLPFAAGAATNSIGIYDRQAGNETGSWCDLLCAVLLFDASIMIILCYVNDTTIYSRIIIIIEPSHILSCVWYLFTILLFAHHILLPRIVRFPPKYRKNFLLYGIIFYIFCCIIWDAYTKYANLHQKCMHVSVRVH